MKVVKSSVFLTFSIANIWEKWNHLGKEPKLQEWEPGFKNTFYSIPEAITLGAWTLSRPFPAGELSPKREILNSKMKWFWRFLIARSEQTNNISWQISMLVFTV